MTQLSNGCGAAAAKPLAEKNQHYGPVLVLLKFLVRGIPA